MKLLAKFNLIFVLVFGTGLAVATWLVYDFLRRDAHEEVVQQARLMMESSLATRNYTSTLVKPLLLPREEHDRLFLPETVPAFAATKSFAFIHRRYPEYSYKEATLNPSNPEDRAVDWEADVINTFRNDHTRTEIVGERQTPTGPSLFLARPITVNDVGCLDCHDTAARAPIAVVRQYGSNNGFGWHMGETVGAQIVSVPEAVAIKAAEQALKNFLVYLIIVAVVTLIVLDLVLLFTVVRPVSRLSTMADEISKGRVDVQELPVKGRDEISILASSFNRMQRSLIRAMKLLEGNEE